MCLADGRTEFATIVNHKIPLARGGADADENTENLCDRHDAIVTAQQFGRSVPAAGVDNSGRPTSADHPWNRARTTT